MWVGSVGGFERGAGFRNQAVTLCVPGGLAVVPPPAGDPHTVTMSFHDGFRRGLAFRNQAVTLCVPGGLADFSQTPQEI